MSSVCDPTNTTRSWNRCLGLMANNLNPTDDYTFSGNVRFRKKPRFPDESVPSAAIEGPISAAKLEGEYSFTLSQPGTVVAETQYLRAVRGAAATVVALEAAITEAIATGVDRAVTIDLLRSTGGGAFASILSAPLVLDNSSTLRALSSAAFASAGLVDGDILMLTVAVSGVAGAQAEGLICSVTIREDAD